MNEIKEKITNPKDISQGKSLKGTEVDNNTNEIESFAKSIANKYETSKNEDNNILKMKKLTKLLILMIFLNLY